jgi:MFS family permease
MTAEKIITRDFALCFLAQFAFSSVYHTLIPTLPIYLSRSGSTEAEIGLLIGIFGVSSLFLRPFVGRALLRIPEKTFMITGALIFVLTTAAYLVAPPFWPFLMVRIFQGTGLAFFYTASVTLIGNISPEARRARSLSYFYLAFNISFALTPIFGMFLINYSGFTLLFLFCAGLSLCSLVITNRIGRTRVHPSENSSADNSLFNRKSLPPSIMVFFLHVIWGTLTTFFPLYALDQGVTNPGLFFTAYAIVLILGRAFGGKILDCYSREKVILPCLITYIISMTLLAYSKSLQMFILVAVIWGIGNAFLIPTLVAYALDLAPSSRGPAMGTFTAISDLGVGLGPVIMGIILRMTSYPIMFLCLALTSVVNLGYFLFFVRRRTLVVLPVKEAAS